MARDDNTELLYSNGVFEYQNRPKRDSGWTFAYLLFVALTVAFGVYGVFNRSTIRQKMLNRIPYYNLVPASITSWKGSSED